MSLPYMPLYVDRLVADTDHMSAEVFGAYVLLLCAMWRRGGWVPDSDSDLARICRVHPSRWKKVRQALDPMLIHEGGLLSQKRLLALFHDARNRSSRQALKASSRWHPKTKKNNGIDDAAAMPRDMHARARYQSQDIIGEPPPIDQAGRLALPIPTAGSSRSGPSDRLMDRTNQRFGPTKPPPGTTLPKPPKEEQP